MDKENKQRFESMTDRLIGTAQKLKSADSFDEVTFRISQIEHRINDLWATLELAETLEGE